MGAYLVRRMVQAVVILLGVTLITFALLYALPADPARMIAGRSATVDTVARIRTELGWVPRHDDLEAIVRQALDWEDHLAKRNRI